MLLREGKINMKHHHLDPYPDPKDKGVLFINEPWIADKTCLENNKDSDIDQKEDNVRVYVPIDLNKDAILRRLDRIIYHYEEANEDNESEFSTDVNMLISQIEIYDQIWYVRHMPKEGEHSAEAVDLVREFVAKLEEIPDGCAEMFPFETIDELKSEYLGEE